MRKTIISLLLICLVSYVKGQDIYTKWARSMGGTDQAYFQKCIADTAHNLSIIGYFKGTFDLNPGTGKMEVTSVGSADAYIIKMDKKRRLNISLLSF